MKYTYFLKSNGCMCLWKVGASGIHFSCIRQFDDSALNASATMHSSEFILLLLQEMHSLCRRISPGYHWKWMLQRRFFVKHMGKPGQSLISCMKTVTILYTICSFLGCWLFRYFLSLLPPPFPSLHMRRHVHSWKLGQTLGSLPAPE